MGTWNQSATSFHFSKGIIYSVVWISAVLMAVAIVSNLINNFRNSSPAIASLEQDKQQ
jgi:TRAP-type C4-dicarboxylate transport system permease small subunit